jgi:hypothetical protein
VQKLVLGAAVALFFGCATNGPQDTTSGPQGYCEKGLYIGTHIVECVAFCENHGEVSIITSTGAPGAIRICKCGDGTVNLISPDPLLHARRSLCHE